MGFAVVDGLVVGALVALALLVPWRRTRIGTAAILVVGVVGGLVGGPLGYALIAKSTATGPLQVAAIVAGAVGALVTLVVLRSWVVGDRQRVVAAAAAERVANAAREKQARRAAKKAAAPGPAPLARVTVLVLVALRWSRA